MAHLREAQGVVMLMVLNEGKVGIAPEASPCMLSENQENLIAIRVRNLSIRQKFRLIMIKKQYCSCGTVILDMLFLPVCWGRAGVGARLAN